MKIKRDEIKAFRTKLVRKQKFICPLCLKKRALSEFTLDHCHKTGYIRRALCRGCNSAEGRVLAWSKRSGASSPEIFLNGLLMYWDVDYTGNPIHPTHLTTEEKELKMLRKKLKRMKSDKGRQRVQDKIKTLQRL